MRALICTRQYPLCRGSLSSSLASLLGDTIASALFTGHLQEALLASVNAPPRQSLEAETTVPETSARTCQRSSDSSLPEAIKPMALSLEGARSTRIMSCASGNDAPHSACSTTQVPIKALTSQLVDALSHHPVMPSNLCYEDSDPAATAAAGAGAASQLASDKGAAEARQCETVRHISDSSISAACSDGADASPKTGSSISSFRHLAGTASSTRADLHRAQLPSHDAQCEQPGTANVLLPGSKPPSQAAAADSDQAGALVSEHATATEEAGSSAASALASQSVPGMIQADSSAASASACDQSASGMAEADSSVVGGRQSSSGLDSATSCGLDSGTSCSATNNPGVSQAVSSDTDHAQELLPRSRLETIAQAQADGDTPARAWLEEEEDGSEYAANQQEAQGSSTALELVHACASIPAQAGSTHVATSTQLGIVSEGSSVSINVGLLPDASFQASAAGIASAGGIATLHADVCMPSSASLCGGKLHTNTRSCGNDPIEAVKLQASCADRSLKSTDVPHLRCAVGAEATEGRPRFQMSAGETASQETAVMVQEAGLTDCTADVRELSDDHDAEPRTAVISWQSCDTSGVVTHTDIGLPGVAQAGNQQAHPVVQSDSKQTQDGSMHISKPEALSDQTQVALLEMVNACGAHDTLCDLIEADIHSFSYEADPLLQSICGEFRDIMQAGEQAIDDSGTF